VVALAARFLALRLDLRHSLAHRRLLVFERVEPSERFLGGRQDLFLMPIARSRVNPEFDALVMFLHRAGSAPVSAR